MDEPTAKSDPIAEGRLILKRVVGNAGMLLGGRVVNAVLGLGYMAVAARALGAADLGQLVLIQAFAQLVGDVMKFQSWQTVLHYGTRPLGEGRVQAFQGVVRFTLFLDAASTVVGLAVGVAAALLFGAKLGWSAEHTPAAAFYMLTVAGMVSATPMGLMRLFDRFDVLARQTALVSFVRLVGSVAAFVFHAPLEGFLVAWAAGQLGGFLYLTLCTLGELRKRDLLKGFTWTGPLGAGMAGAWRFAWNTNLSATIDITFTHVVTLVVGAMAGPTQAAFWRVGRQAADALAKPARLLVPALYPELARLRADGDEAGMRRLAGRVGLLAGGVSLTLLAVSALAGPSLLKVVMGKAFAAAGPVMNWQVAAAVIGIFALPLEPMLISLGKTGPTVRVQLAVGLLYLAALPFVLRRIGLVGAGAGLVAAEVAMAIGLLWLLLRHNKAGRVAAAANDASTHLGLADEFDEGP